MVVEVVLQKALHPVEAGEVHRQAVRVVHPLVFRVAEEEQTQDVRVVHPLALAAAALMERQVLEREQPLVLVVLLVLKVALWEQQASPSVGLLEHHHHQPVLCSVSV